MRGWILMENLPGLNIPISVHFMGKVMEGIKISKMRF